MELSNELTIHHSMVERLIHQVDLANQNYNIVVNDLNLVSCEEVGYENEVRGTKVDTYYKYLINYPLIKLENGYIIGLTLSKNKKYNLLPDTHKYYNDATTAMAGACRCESCMSRNPLYLILKNGHMQLICLTCLVSDEDIRRNIEAYYNKLSSILYDLYDLSVPSNTYYHSRYTIESVISVACAYIRENGWISKSEVSPNISSSIKLSTSEMVAYHFSDNTFVKLETVEVQEGDVKRANDIIKWFSDNFAKLGPHDLRNEVGESKIKLMSDVQACFKLGAIDYDKIGSVSCLCAIYDNIQKSKNVAKDWVEKYSKGDVEDLVLQLKTCSYLHHKNLLMFKFQDPDGVDFVSWVEMRQENNTVARRYPSDNSGNNLKPGHFYKVKAEIGDFNNKYCNIVINIKDGRKIINGKSSPLKYYGVTYEEAAKNNIKEMII